MSLDWAALLWKITLRMGGDHRHLSLAHSLTPLSHDAGCFSVAALQQRKRKEREAEDKRLEEERAAKEAAAAAAAADNAEGPPQGGPAHTAEGVAAASADGRPGDTKADGMVAAGLTPPRAHAPPAAGANPQIGEDDPILRAMQEAAMKGTTGSAGGTATQGVAISVGGVGSGLKIQGNKVRLPRAFPASNVCAFQTLYRHISPFLSVFPLETRPSQLPFLALPPLPFSQPQWGVRIAAKGPGKGLQGVFGEEDDDKPKMAPLPTMAPAAGKKEEESKGGSKLSKESMKELIAQVRGEQDPHGLAPRVG